MAASRLDIAITMAVAAHEGQLDKQDCPYILHPLRVMLGGTTEEERVVGVLHDVYEDSPRYSLVDAADLFGHEIAVALDLLTKNRGVPYLQYISNLKLSPLAVQVKLLDIQDNLNRVDGLWPSEAARLKEKYAGALNILYGKH